MKTNNLNTFRILFLIQGLFSLFGSLFAFFYAVFGMFAFTEITKHDEHMPFNPGYIFLILGGIGFVILVTFGILSLMASKRLNEKRGYQFIFVISILSCLTGILGILLGIFTLIEISKPEVKSLFDGDKNQDDFTR